MNLDDIPMSMKALDQEIRMRRLKDLCAFLLGILVTVLFIVLCRFVWVAGRNMTEKYDIAAKAHNEEYRMQWKSANALKREAHRLEDANLTNRFK